MPDCPLDLKGYYAILRLTPGAGLEQVKQAYQEMEGSWRQNKDLPRFQIQEAYRFLSDPQAKAAYDAQCGPKAGPPSKSRPMVLSGAMLFLVVVAGFISPGFLLGGPEPFHAGDILVHSGGKGILGTVRRLESSHHYPTAMIGEAYLIESPAGERRWYPAGDLERYYHRQSTVAVTLVD